MRGPAELLTRPWLVLALRAAWDVSYGLALLVGLQLALRAAPDVGAATIGVGLYTAAVAVRAHRRPRGGPEILGCPRCGNVAEAEYGSPCGFMGLCRGRLTVRIPRFGTDHRAGTPGTTPSAGPELKRST